MPPKFQSSFIPSKPVGGSAAAAPSFAPHANVIPQAAPVRHHDIVSFAARLIFTLSLIAAAAAVGYKFYLNYSIAQMGRELETLRSQIATSQTNEIIRLNSRITTTEMLVQNHKVLTPVFAFLESSTPQSVSLREFNFATTDKGPQVVIKGLAKSYSSLALEAATIGKNASFKNPQFSDIQLDQNGNVAFTMMATLSPDLLSYQKMVSQLAVPPALPPAPPVVATSSVKVSTTTPKVATSTKAATTTSAPPLPRGAPTIH